MIRCWRRFTRMGKCGRCRQPVKLVTTDEGRTRALRPNALILQTDVDEKLQVEFDSYAGDTLHVIECKPAPKKKKR